MVNSMGDDELVDYLAGEDIECEWNQLCDMFGLSDDEMEDLLNEEDAWNIVE